MKSWKGTLFILGAAVSWGLTAAAAKGLINRALDPRMLAQARVTVASLLLVCGLLLFRPQALRVRLRDLWSFALLGVVGMAGAQVTLYLTMEASTVATGIVLQYGAPVLVLAYALLSGREPVTGWKLGAALVAVSGCVLTVGGLHPGGLLLNTRAVLLGSASAVCFAFLTVYTRSASRGYEMVTVVAYATAAASLFWLVVRPRETLEMVGALPSLLVTLVGLGVGSVLIPYLLYFAGLRLIAPGRAVVLATFEPVVAIVTADLLLGERLDAPRLAGAALVIAAITVLQMHRDPLSASEGSYGAQ